MTTAWQEPQMQLDSKSPYCKAKVTESGHIQIFDDTPGSEEVITLHRKGTYTFMTKDGHMVNHIVGDNFLITEKDNNILVQGNCNITIQGDANVNIQGNCNSRVKGNEYKLVEGNYELLVKGKMTMSGSDINIKNLSEMGDVSISAGDRLVLNTDLTVHGEVLADSVYSEGSVTAGTGIHAGVLGSKNPIAGISTLGGVNVGIAGPTIPGVTYSNVMSNSPMHMSSLLCFGLQVWDAFGSMNMMRKIYDIHKHPGVMTGPDSTKLAVPLMLP